MKKNAWSIVGTLALLMGLAATANLLPIILPGLAVAEDFHIKNGDVNSLIAAINAANNNDLDNVINLAKGGRYTLKTVYAEDTGLPPITSLIRINGNGATINRDASQGTPEFRIFYVQRGGNLTLNRVTVKNGKNVFGGGIVVDGILRLVNGSYISNNQGTAGGGIFVGGNILGGGIIEIKHSTVSNNLAYYGGGIFADNGATTEIIKSRITGNRAVQQTEPVSSGWGGGIANVGFGSSLVIRDSLIDRNSAVQGGGIYHNTGKAVVFNSIVSNDTATSGDGGAIAKFGDALLIAHYNCITKNSDIALFSDGTSPEVNAAYNWWGAVDGPSGSGSGSGDSVSANVAFSPFLKAPTAAQCQPWKAGDDEEEEAR
jgi:hypothetical protein